VAERVEAVYARAAAAPRPQDAALRRRAGIVPVDGSSPVPARRIPMLESEPANPGRRARAARRTGLAAAALVGAVLAYLAASRIGLGNVAEAIVRSEGSWILAGTALMIASLFLRAESWLSIARSALPGTPLRRRDVTSATMIGVLMSATLPARLGEPARAMVLARHTVRARETFPVLLGTLVSQTVLNVAALVILGAIIVGSTELFAANTEQLFLVSTAPLLLLGIVLVAPSMVRDGGTSRLARSAAVVRGALLKVRTGLVVFRNPRSASVAAATQLGAWALQLLACLILLAALGLDDRPGIGIGAAAAVLFAVNVTAVIPATPSNIGVFQLAVISVLTTGFGLSAADALAYGVILQAVEIATAVVLGLPALVREGVTWSDMRLRTLSSGPVRLAPIVGEGATDSAR